MRLLFVLTVGANFLFADGSVHFLTYAADAVLAAIAATLAWGPLMRKRISRLTAESLPWWLRLFGTLIGASVDADRHEADRFCGMAVADILGKRSLTEVAYVALLRLAPQPANVRTNAASNRR